MNFLKELPQIHTNDILKNIEEIKAGLHTNPISNKKLDQICSLIDLTTLEATDTPAKIAALCDKALRLKENSLPEVAAICVYPPFVQQVKSLLRITPIACASVAGAFPSGQSPIQVKVAEVHYAVEQGADEIDMVISRGKMLDGQHQEVFDEILAIKQACGKSKLKVILETGELTSLQMIYHAAALALHAGADFVKTSTGKIPQGATPEAIYTLLLAVREHYLKTRRMAGVKASGGVAEIDQAALYLEMTEQILGENYCHAQHLRIGASRLLDKIIDAKKNG